jgi:hypothetical protein
MIPDWRSSNRASVEARRYAEKCMRNADLLAERLARPVNKIGSTAEEYGRGDIDAALLRPPFDTTKRIMLKIYGATDEQIGDGAAHLIGRYKLGLGDLLFTYVDGLKKEDLE